MGALAKSTYISPDEYLLRENDRPDDIKHEYVNGQIYAMAGASRGHNLVTMAFSALLFNHLRGSGWLVFQSDMKVRIQTLDGTRFYYPDVQVAREEETESHFNTSPCLILEVLSGSSALKDRSEKLSAYRLIPALQEYVLCSQDSPHVEIYRRSTEWKMEHYTTAQTFQLESVKLEVAVDDLYAFLLGN
jgi:Uma2 family endonuclease